MSGPRWDYRRRRAAGLCIKCPDKVLEGDTRALCPACRSRSYDRARLRRKALKGVGRCQQCGAPARRFTRCLSCRLDQRARWHVARAGATR